MVMGEAKRRKDLGLTSFQGKAWRGIKPSRRVKWISSTYGYGRAFMRQQHRKDMILVRKIARMQANIEARKVLQRWRRTV